MCIRDRKVRALQDNSETLYTYWNIGRLIIEAQGGKKRAKYGDCLIKECGCKLSCLLYTSKVQLV